MTLSFRSDIHHERVQIDIIQKYEIDQKDVASENMRDMAKKRQKMTSGQWVLIHHFRFTSENGQKMSQKYQKFHHC